MTPTKTIINASLSSAELSSATLCAQLSRAQSKRIFHDSFLREVRINYQRIAEPTFQICEAEDVAGFVRKILSDNSREHVVALYLDGSHQVTSYSIVSIGTANYALVHPREVFQRAIAAGAIAIVIAHNHPSGHLEPSTEDRLMTNRLKEAGELLGIRLLDHIIVTEAACYSFQEHLLI
jgi:DNA repair protein RadC